MGTTYSQAKCIPRTNQLQAKPKLQFGAHLQMKTQRYPQNRGPRRVGPESKLLACPAPDPVRVGAASERTRPETVGKRHTHTHTHTQSRETNDFMPGLRKKKQKKRETNDFNARIENKKHKIDEKPTD